MASLLRSEYLASQKPTEDKPPLEMRELSHEKIEDLKQSAADGSAGIEAAASASLWGNR